MSKKDMTILLVEDNPGDVDLILDALSKQDKKIRDTVHIAEDGEKALDYLYKRDEYQNAKTPNLIFLDLNLPRKNGFDILRTVKTDKNLKKIPVIIFTSSESEKDITQSYALNANAYITKPINLKSFFDVIETTWRFWSCVTKIPTNT